MTRYIIPVCVFGFFIAVIGPGIQHHFGYSRDRQNAGQSDQDAAWPPQPGERLPNPVFIDMYGNEIELHQLRGPILLIEPIGMPCEACQAFVGGHEHGGFGDIQPQQDMPSIRELAHTYGDVDLDDPRILNVQLLLFDMDLGTPTADDARRWAEHFGITDSPGHVVLAGNSSLLNKKSFQRIPGFWLVDEDLIVQADSTGHQPHDDLYEDLLPKLRMMLDTPQSDRLDSYKQDPPGFR